MISAKSQAVIEAEAFHNAMSSLVEGYGRRLQALAIENVQLRQEQMIARGRAAKEKANVPPPEPAPEVPGSGAPEAPAAEVRRPDAGASLSADSQSPDPLEP